MMLETAGIKNRAMRGKARHVSHPFAFLLGAMFLLAPITPPLVAHFATARAQESADINALRREVSALRRAVADLQTTPNGQGGGNAVVADLQVRMQQMFEQFRTMTGNQERLENRVRKLEERLDKLITDIDFRLRDVEANAEAAAGKNNTGFAPSMPGDEDNLARPVAPGSGGGTGGVAVGTTSPRAILFPPEGDQSAAPVAEDPKAQYEAALTLVNNREFEAAEAAMKRFVEQHPGHPLAGNALYWLGETFYARKRYQEAATVFGEAYVTNRGGVKAAHSLLKLAMSLDLLGRDGDACTAYAELLAKHGDAEARILKYARDARKRLSCP